MERSPLLLYEISFQAKPSLQRALSRRKKRLLVADSGTSWTPVAGYFKVILKHTVSSKLEAGQRTRGTGDCCVCVSESIFRKNPNVLKIAHHGRHSQYCHCITSAFCPLPSILYLMCYICATCVCSSPLLLLLYPGSHQQRLLSSPHYEPGPLKRQMFLLEGIFISLIN